MSDGRHRTPLRILCCHAPGQLRALTHATLSEAGDTPGVQIRYVTISTSDPYHYGSHIAWEWNDARHQNQALAIVEQDIVIRPDVTDAFLHHEADYIAFPYAWTTNIGPALGCTRWSHAFLERHPRAAERAAARHVTYRQFDVVLMRHVLARELGEQPTVLLPPVEHLNEAKALLPGADPTPMTEVPLW